MSRGINKVILVGHLGRDPEVRYTPSGSAIANIAVATSDAWKDKQTGEMQERTEWHRVVFFNRLAEIAGEYLTKGSHVYVEGRLQTRKWQDKDGQDRYTTEIVANEMQMLGGRGGSSSGSSNTNDFGDFDQSAKPAQQQNAPKQQPMLGGRGGSSNTNDFGDFDQSAKPAQQQNAPKQQPKSSGAFDDFDDDIPF